MKKNTVALSILHYILNENEEEEEEEEKDEEKHVTHTVALSILSGEFCTNTERDRSMKAKD
jgi:hypothetical protein